MSTQFGDDARPGNAPGSGSGGTFGVLLVEDDPMQRMSAAEALRASGLDVVESGSIDGAVAALDGHAGLRAMVADVDLVGEAMTGFMLAKAVAARWPDLVLLVVSGVAVPAADQLPAGARFLRKPYDVRELAGMLRALVERRAQGLADEPDGPGDAVEDGPAGDRP